MSNNSGADLKCGRTNGAEDGTMIVAQQKQNNGNNFTEFSQDFIFQAAPFPTNDVRTPEKSIDGIRGLGCPVELPGEPVRNFQGGRGVWGLGGAAGTGVEGRGGGAGVAAGIGPSGGIGVAGFGGDATPVKVGAPPPANPMDPGTGVIGTGGKQDPNTVGTSHGAGVIGVGGDGDFPPFPDSASVGVFGQGGNAARRTIRIPGVPSFTAGPDNPGIGVIGRGGTTTTDGATDDNAGPGVVRVAGDALLPSTPPPTPEMQGVGVFGRGSSNRGSGVLGEGVIGVSGISTTKLPGV